MRAPQRDPPLYVLARENDDECGERCQNGGGGDERSSAVLKSQLKIEN